MTDQLLDHARRYADAHADRTGVAATPVEGLVILRETAPTMLLYAVSKPLVALVLQGGKRVTMGSSSFDFGAGDSLLITTDVPTVSQITTASRALPYYALVLELDPAIITGLVDEIGPVPFEADRPVRVDPTEAEVADAALRLLRLLDRPDTLAVLGPHLAASCTIGCSADGMVVRSGRWASPTATPSGSRVPSSCFARTMPRP